ncbi:lipopolysaccharide biosynthesis protein [Flavobacterium croceum]|uniref:lipopolysaccharide biosynthesis protein n=1 Tax=Flavobacterium croceum TaxID=370975 RepID=UPI0024A86873|nr:hypothetical protein [Flavobacterium croceum]
MKKSIIESFKNPAVYFVFSRYFTYAVQFVNSLFIAVYLGSYYLGIWGFLNIIISYVFNLNFGVSQAANILILTNKENEKFSKKIINNGFTLTTILSILTLLFFLTVKIFRFKFGLKYDFNTYFIPMLVIVFFTHLNIFMSNIYRVYNQLGKTVLYQSLFPLLLLLIIPFYREKELLWYMVLLNSLVYLVSFLVFIFNFPIKLQFDFDMEFVKRILSKGLYLFLYNSSFYLILLSTRSFISNYYKVEEFGQFTFSFSLANIALLLLESLSFVIFPKIINKFSTESEEKIKNMLQDLRIVFITLSHFMIHTAIMLYPFMMLFLSQYKDSIKSFQFIALTILIYENSYGYQGLLLAKNKEKLLSYLSIFALFINVLVIYFFVAIIHVTIEKAIIATLITYFLYVLSVGYFGRILVYKKTSLFETIYDLFPIKLMLPYSISLIIAFYFNNIIYNIIPFFIYMVLNFSDLLKLKNMALKLIKNKNVIKI